MAVGSKKTHSFWCWSRQNSDLLIKWEREYTFLTLHKLFTEIVLPFFYFWEEVVKKNQLRMNILEFASVCTSLLNHPYQLKNWLHGCLKVCSLTATTGSRITDCSVSPIMLAKHASRKYLCWFRQQQTPKTQGAQNHSLLNELQTTPSAHSIHIQHRICPPPRKVHPVLSGVSQVLISHQDQLLPTLENKM